MTVRSSLVTGSAVLALVAGSAGIAAAPAPAIAATPEERAASLVAQMSLDEKILQVHTSGDGSGGVPRLVPGIARLGIPDLRINNGPAGVGSGSVPNQPKATALPAPVALSATFDPSLAGQYGVVQGRETGNVGHNLLEAPDVNIVRVPQSGRAFENYGEDPYLAGQLAVANINGIQSQGVMAEAKHAAVYNIENPAGTVVVDNRTLQELYLPAFQTAVTQGATAAVMCAYSVVNSVPACQNPALLNTPLYQQAGFGGFVTSDWGGTHST
ncbi:MAG: beta-glucosidase, partial [Cryptosporangiaceae bacterium]|nr:beta-glucosidase [Cryptosporangiaceae bacterium]